MSLAFQEDSVGLHATVPTQTVSLSSFSLLQAAFVQLPGVGVVVVDRRNSRILFLELLARVEDQHRQMLQDDELELGDVVRVHPVLGRLTDEVLLLTTSTRITSGRVSARSHLIVELGEVDHSNIVVVLEERSCA